MRSWIRKLQRTFKRRKSRQPIRRSRPLVEQLEDRCVPAAPVVGPVVATSPISENAFTNLTGTVIDAVDPEDFTVTVDWGDGTAPETFNFLASDYVAGVAMIDLEHQYLDDDADDTFTISVTATDTMGTSAPSITTVVVTNVAPTVDGLAATATAENGFSTLTGFIQDQGTLDTFTVLVDWGDGTTPESFTFDAGTTSFDLEHQYLDDDADDTFTINVSVTDDDGGTGTGSTTATVTNVAPTVDGLAATPTAENGFSTLTGFIQDQGTLDTFLLTVDWGDGTTPETFTFDAGTTSFDLEHQYLNDGTFTINVSVTDDDGGTGTGSTTVTVTNVAPTVDGLSATATAENGFSTLTGLIQDQGSQDAVTLLVDWGDGNAPETFTFDPGTTSFDLQHQYLDDDADDTFTITVTPSDSGGSGTPVTTTVTVTNVAPTLDGLAATPTAENGFSTLTGFIQDQGTLDTFMLTVDWGDGTAPEMFTFDAGTTSFDLEHQYLNDGTFTINVSVTDDDGGTGTGSTTVTVTNVAPSVDGLAATATAENGFSTLTGLIQDQGSQDAVTLTVDWGDGTTPEVFTFDPGTTSFDLEHQYLDDDADDTFTITVTAADSGGSGAPATTTVTVTNVAPTLDALQTTAANEGSPTTLTGFVQDQGTLDTFVLMINWGDNTPVQSVSLPAGSTTFSVPHTYADNGTFTINVTVTDDDGGTGTGTATATIADVAPVVTLSGNPDTPSGQPYSLGLMYTDPGADTISSVTVTWGDGSVETFPGMPATVTHVFTAVTDTVRTISATVTNEDGTFPALNTLTITVQGMILTGSQAFVAQAYRDLLLREADPMGLAFFSNLLDTGQATRTQVAGFILFSDEGRGVLVQRLYQECLGRPADPTGFADAVNFLANGGTLDTLRAFIIGSQEFFQTRGGGTNDGFLNALYQKVLGRPIDPSGQATYSNLLAQGFLREQVAGFVLTSVEADTVATNRIYQEFLGRPADPDALNNAVAFFQQGGREETLIVSLVGSDEYLNTQVTS